MSEEKSTTPPDELVRKLAHDIVADSGSVSKPAVAAPYATPDEVAWLRRFIACSVFSPPPDEVQRALRILDTIAFHSATQPINQCDGCRRGLPLRANNIHYDGEFPSALPVMGCTADRYISSATLSPLEQLALAVLEEYRESGIGDIDGGWFQDKAEKLGVLVPVEVQEPCGDYCPCAELADFPQLCYRYSAETKAKSDTADRGSNK